EEMTSVQQITVKTRTVRKLPRVSDVALHVDEIHRAVTEHRREERVALKRPRGVVGDQSRARAADALLVDARGHRAGRALRGTARVPIRRRRALDRAADRAVA